MNFKDFCDIVDSKSLPDELLIPTIKSLKIKKSTWDKRFKNDPEMLKLGWKLLSGREWSRLLSNKPQFAQYCDWSLLTEEDWYHLLKEQPQFSKYQHQLETPQLLVTLQKHINEWESLDKEDFIMETLVKLISKSELINIMKKENIQLID